MSIIQIVPSQVCYKAVSQSISLNGAQYEVLSISILKNYKN
jgi:hypothetical protein